MAIRDSDTPALTTLVSLVRDILAKTFTILGEQAKAATSSQLDTVKYDIIAAIPPVPADVVRDSTLAAAQAAIIAAIPPMPADVVRNSTLEAAKTEIISALAGSGAKPGEARQFLQGLVPAGWQSFTDNVTYPGKGIILQLGLPYVPGPGVAAYVADGAGAGYWYLSGLTLRRYDLDTNSAIGPAYTFATGRNTIPPFLVAIGKYLYTGGGATSYGAVADLLRFDTETGAVFRLANLPRAIAYADAVALDDGRLLFWAQTTTGLTQTMAATAFWLYDPATNLTAIEVLVSLPLLGALSASGRNLAKLPSGRVMIIETSDVTPATAAAHSTRYSCVLTISGNSITAGPAEDSRCTATTNSVILLPSAAGAHCFYNGQVVRTYIEGTGWTESAQVFAHRVSASLGSNVGYSCALPGGTGWLTTTNSGGGAAYVHVLLTSPNTPGRALVYARKL